MNSIPTQKENPNGLHQRYVIKKIEKTEVYVPNSHSSTYRIGGDWRDIKEFGELTTFEKYRHITKEVDKEAEYFVLRLDDGGKDPKHIAACRVAINAYADAIESHLPELAKDLRERYAAKQTK